MNRQYLPQLLGDMDDTMPAATIRTLLPPPSPQMMAPSVTWRNSHAIIDNVLNKSPATEDDVSFLPDEVRCV